MYRLHTCRIRNRASIYYSNISNMRYYDGDRLAAAVRCVNALCRCVGPYLISSVPNDDNKGFIDLHDNVTKLPMS